MIFITIVQFQHLVSRIMFLQAIVIHIFNN
jgi:hypothetical protein